MSEAGFQQEEIALEQSGWGSWSFVAGVFVFVNVGFDQVGHFTGVHLPALTVTHLRRTHTQPARLLCLPAGSLTARTGGGSEGGTFSTALRTISLYSSFVISFFW